MKGSGLRAMDMFTFQKRGAPTAPQQTQNPLFYQNGTASWGKLTNESFGLGFGRSYGGRIGPCIVMLYSPQNSIGAAGFRANPNPKHQTPNPKSQTPNPKPETLNSLNAPNPNPQLPKSDSSKH